VGHLARAGARPRRPRLSETRRRGCGASRIGSTARGWPRTRAASGRPTQRPPRGGPSLSQPSLGLPAGLPQMDAAPDASAVPEVAAAAGDEALRTLSHASMRCGGCGAKVGAECSRGPVSAHLGSSRLIDGAGWRDGALAGDGAAARGGPFARGEAPHCPRRARGAGRLRRPRAVEHAVRPLRRLLPLLPARPLRLRASGRQPRPLRLPRHGRAARRCPRGGGRPVRARGEGRGAPLPQRGVARPPLGAFSDPSRSAPPSRRRSSR